MCHPYAPPATLRALIAGYQKNRAVPEPLALVLLKIAEGVWDRYRFTPERADFVQDAVAHLLAGEALDRIDLAKNPFSYLTTCIVNFGLKARRKAERAARSERAYLAAVQEGRLDEERDLAELSPELRAAARHLAAGDQASAQKLARKALRTPKRKQSKCAA